ncbi:hypothetical protein SY88_09385 [Clostridiales bacterium PH28_bin88]|nr:hypothetical protein SY88_09385 [Clostridiales bacterium PH28_bin88]
MRLSDIAVNNLKVRRAKMLFLVLGMVVGIGTIVTLFSITYAMRQQVQGQFEAMGTRVVVSPFTQKLSLSYNGITVASGVSFQAEELPASVMEAIESIPSGQELKVVAPKLLNITPVESRQVLVAGVEFPEEYKLHPYWRPQGREPSGPRELLLGFVTAAKAGKSPGDVIDIDGESFTVAGILNETGGPEDRLVFMDLQQARLTFNRPSGFSFIELVLPRAGTGQADQNTRVPGEAILGQLKEALPDAKISVVKDEGEARREVVDRFAKFSFLVTAVVFGIGVLIIGTTMMSSVNERTREIGIFRAIGFRRSHIMRIILTEAALVSAAGGVAGYLAGMGTAMLVAPLIAQIQVSIRWNPFLAVGVVLLSIVTGLSASLYPAIRAARLDPTEAFRFI